MKRTVIRIAFALGLVLAGWTIGRAGTAEPDFVLLVDSPLGTTNVQCVRGCELLYAPSASNPSAVHMPTFTYTCSGSERCSSREIAGWIRR